MSRHRNTATGVVVSVDDTKDDRYTNGWEPAGKQDDADAQTAKRAAVKQPATSK